MISFPQPTPGPAWNTQRWDHRVLSTLLGIIETEYHMWYVFHPQGKNRSHADLTEDTAKALLTFETDSKTRLKTTLAKHSSDHINNCDARALPHDFQPLNALPQYAGKKKNMCFEKVLKLLYALM